MCCDCGFSRLWGIRLESKYEAALIRTQVRKQAQRLGLRFEVSSKSSISIGFIPFRFSTKAEVFVCVEPKCWGPESILFGPTQVSTLLELRVLSSEHIVWHKLHPNGPMFPMFSMFPHVRAMILKASAICQGERSRIASSTPLCGRRQRYC